MAWLLPSLGAGDAAVAVLGDAVTVVLVASFPGFLWSLALAGHRNTNGARELWLSISLTAATFGLIFAKKKNEKIEQSGKAY